MLFPEKEIALKDGRSACLRSPATEDAAEMLAYLKDCASETHFILREPEECTETLEQETAYLERVSASDTSVMIVCSVGQEDPPPGRNRHCASAKILGPGHRHDHVP